MKKPFASLLSLFAGLIATFICIGYGITDEVPVGSVSGTVVMQENGKALPKAFVSIVKLGKDELYEDEEIATEHRFRADKTGHFTLHDIVAGRYKVVVSTEAHHAARLLDVDEGKTADLRIEAEPKVPDLSMYASQRVYLPSESPKIQVNGFTQKLNLTTKIYRLDFDKVVRDGGLYNAMAPLARSDSGKVKDPSTMGQLTSTETMPLAGKVDAEGVFHIAEFPIGPQNSGIYWMQCTDGNLTRGTWFSVSRIALITKSANSDVAAYVTKLDTGEPVVGAEVGVSSSSGISPAVTTGHDGLARVKLSAEGGANVVIASFGDSKALVDFRAAQAGDEGDDEGDGPSSQTHIYCYTDRPIYRPGDLIQFKGIVRQLNGPDYALPKLGKVNVDFADGSGNVISSQELTLSPLGTYHGQFQLTPDSLPDNYSIVTHYGGATDSKDVGVASYRKPSFSISVTPEKKSYVRGDTARMDVDAKYYYGAPVVGALVTATVTRTEHWSSPEDENDAEVDNSADRAFPGQSLHQDSYGEETQQLKAITDANGKAVIAFPTVGANEPEETASDYDYSVSVSIKDASNKEFDGDGSVTVYRSDTDLTLDTNPLVVEAGQAFDATATLKSRSHQALAGVPVTFTSYFVDYTKEGKMVENDQQQTTVATDASGAAAVHLQPPGQGYYEVRAEFNDDRGHKVSNTTGVYLFSSSAVSSAFEDTRQPTLSIVLDKKQYKVGDDAKALILCNDPGGTALVGVESSAIHNVQTVKLGGKSTLVRFKVTQEFAPDVFVSVAYIRNKRFSSVDRQMLIDLGIRKLKVSLTSDKKTYHPGERATYTVTTKNASGAPVPAELSLGVVDESVYAIFDDQSDIVKAFYPKRSDDVQTNFSFPEMYLGGGDKAPTNIQVRRKFSDTAYWGPVVETDRSGRAKVSITLPDNLTSWRATVRAVTADTEVGQVTENVVSQKDLMIQLSAPAYVVKGDEQRMVAMVTNNTPADADVRVTLQATNAKVNGDLNATVHVAKGAVQTVEYKVDTVETGEADFVGKAWIPSGPSDGMELKLPVRPRARLVTDGYGGVTTSSKEIEFDLKPGADQNTGGLEIDVSPTMAAGLVDSVGALVDYPYGCVEQTTSRFLPTVLLAKTYAEIGLPKPKLSKDIPAIVQDSFQRLRAMQHQDGGWGWWEYDESDPHMTAYVLEALAKAREAGYDTPKGINVQGAYQWSEAFLAKGRLPAEYERPTTEELSRLLSDKLYLAYALALEGEGDKAKAFLKAQRIAGLDAAQAALAALAYGAMGAGEVAGRDAALNRMLSLAKETRLTLSWSEQDWWGYETTGRCFQALETLQPESPLMPKLVTYLLQSRTGDMWYSTRDTAIVLIPLIDYLRRSKELVASGGVTVSLNGKQVWSGQFQAGSFPARSVPIKLHVTDMKPGTNKIVFEAHGPTCYYIATLKQYDAEENMPAMPEGNQLSVERAYYRLEARRMEDGTLKLMPSKQPITDYKSGDIIQCVLKIHADADRRYVFVEDPTPSGMHVTDREAPDDGENWAWWWSRTVILDDRVCLFANYMKAGDNQFSYVMQAENPGSCTALPTAIYNMYDASDAASSAALALEVNP